jgi:MoxR-like ATPase
MTAEFEPSKLFKPTQAKSALDQTSSQFGERGGGTIYVWDEKIVFAVQAAQATGRPLLLRGDPGSGKSSLAPFVANVIGEPFYLITVTARTQARDMMWEFDALRRLNDANVSAADASSKQRVASQFNYLSPCPLWWAFDRAQAKLRGTELSNLAPDVGAATDPAKNATGRSAVVLIDEIDKADPDVPNNLLEALGSRRFRVQETGTEVVDTQRPLVMITTNDERELPSAFLRRCLALRLREKTAAELVAIAQQHFGARDDELYADVAAALEAERKSGTRAPSTAEYLDTLAACIHLELPSRDTTGERFVRGASGAPEKRRWDYLIEVALAKRPAEPAEPTPSQALPQPT